MTYRHIDIRLSEETLKKVKRLSCQQDISMSCVIGDVIRSFLSERRVFHNKKSKCGLDPDLYVVNKISKHIKNNKLCEIPFFMNKEKHDKLREVSKKLKISKNEILRTIIKNFLLEKANSQTNDSSSGSDDSSL